MLTYFRDHSPKGDFIAYWPDKNHEYNVLILYQREGEYRFSLEVFPEVVSHWSHQISGWTCAIGEIKEQLDRGLRDTSERTKERVRVLVEHIENGLGIDDIISACRQEYDPRGVLKPFKPSLPFRGPRLTSEGQYRTVLILANALADDDLEIAGESVRKLAAMGITEDDGPLFARNALLSFRKRQASAARLTPTASAAATSPDSAERKEKSIPSEPFIRALARIPNVKPAKEDER